MEEGKRMFSIFAARMFEQRVLQAYREKVAQERQMQLLRELDEEEKMSATKAKSKMSQNQKKKDKKRCVVYPDHSGIVPDDGLQTAEACPGGRARGTRGGQGS